ncbi:hypothetical protein ACVU7I_01755 [Patulibacter sp. S7RM1-6]
MARGTNISWPNREKASSKLMRLLVIVALLVSAALIAVTAARGWDLMQDGKALLIVFVVIDLIFVLQLLRWSRGVLPMAAGLATFVAIFAGVSIQSWYDRDAPGFDEPGLSAQIGFMTILILAAQLVVIVLAVLAFRQNWQVEVERRDDDAPTGGRRGRRDAVAA